MPTPEELLPPGFQVNPEDSLPEGFVLDSTNTSSSTTDVPEVTPEQDGMEWKDALSKGLKALPESSWNLYSDTIDGLWEAVKHPIDTTQAVMEVGLGMAEKAIPGEQMHEKKADPVIKYFKGRYGSIENFKNTVATDPASVLADAGGVLFAGGGVVRGAGLMSKVSGATKLGKGLSKVGKVVQKGGALDPLTGVTLGTSKIAKGLGMSPTSLYKTAAKMGSKLTEAQKTAFAKLAIKEGIMPTPKGLDSLGKKIDAVTDNINRHIDRGVKEGKYIKVKDIGEGFDEMILSMKNNYDPVEAISTAAKVRQKIMDFNQQIRRKKLNPREAQEIKVSIYEALEKHYDNTLKDRTKIKAIKLLGRNLKENLEKILPEIKSLNNSSAEFRELRKALKNPTSRITNRDVMSLGGRVGFGALLGTGASPGAGTAAGIALMMMAEHPKFKARLAITLNRMARAGLKPSPLMVSIVEGGAVGERVRESEGRPDIEEENLQ